MKLDLWTVKSVLRFLFSHLLVFVLLLLTFEFGLRAASWFKSVSREQKAIVANKPLDVVLVGDSILGTLEDPESAAGRFFYHFKKIVPPAEIEEVTRGGLTSEEAFRSIQTVLNDRPPKSVILMVGKNDWARGWVDKSFQRLVHSPAGKLEISKAFMVVAADLHRRYLRIWPDLEARRQDRDMRKAWYLYGEQRLEAIPEFEEQLRKHPNYVRAIRALVHLYYLHGRLDEGILYLESLKSASSEKALIDVHIGYLKSDRLKATGEKLAPDDRGWESSIRSMSDQRLAFIARLRMSYIAGEAKAFAKEFVSMGPEESEVLLPSTLNNLDKLIDLLLRSGVRVIMVDYPSHHSLPLRRALSKYDSDIEIYDSREWLLRDLHEESLITAFQPDCDHLELPGAEVVGSELSRILSK